MRNALGIFFLLLYMTALLRPYTPYIEYALHQSYIAQNLCENRDKPALHCNGHCYLMKKVRQAQEAEQAPTLPSAKKMWDDVVVHDSPRSSEHSATFTVSEKRTFFAYDLCALPQAAPEEPLPPPRG